MLLTNAFSLNMLPPDGEFVLKVRPVGLDEAKNLASGSQSAVGHADTARVLSGLLGTEVACVRSTITLQRGDKALVTQYRGPRLPEGATSLPAGATIAFSLVEVC